MLYYNIDNNEKKELENEIEIVFMKLKEICAKMIFAHISLKMILIYCFYVRGSGIKIPQYFTLFRCQLIGQLLQVTLYIIDKFHIF